MEKLIETHVKKPEVSYLDKASNQNLRAITLEDELFLDYDLQDIQIEDPVEYDLVICEKDNYIEFGGNRKEYHKKKEDHFSFEQDYDEIQHVVVIFSEKGSRSQVMSVDDFIELITSFEDSDEENDVEIPDTEVNHNIFMKIDSNTNKNGKQQNDSTSQLDYNELMKELASEETNKVIDINLSIINNDDNFFNYLIDKNYEQILSCDCGDMIFQKDISHLFYENKEGFAKGANPENETDLIHQGMLRNILEKNPGYSLSAVIKNVKDQAVLENVKINIQLQNPLMVDSAFTASDGKYQKALPKMKPGDSLVLFIKLEKNGYLTKESVVRIKLKMPGIINLNEYLNTDLGKIEVGLDIAK